MPVKVDLQRRFIKINRPSWSVRIWVESLWKLKGRPIHRDWVHLVFRLGWGLFVFSLQLGRLEVFTVDTNMQAMTVSGLDNAFFRLRLVSLNMALFVESSWVPGWTIKRQQGAGG